MATDAELAELIRREFKKPLPESEWTVKATPAERALAEAVTRITGGDL